MHDEHESTSGSTRSTSDDSGTFPRPDEQVDRDRIASMADEGGSAAAVTDLREQLEYPATAYIGNVTIAPLLAPQPVRRMPWRTLIWSALAVGAAGFFGALLLRYRARGA